MTYIELHNDKNYTEVLMGRMLLYFSYNTIVAFKTPKTGLRVCENIWTTTTGKHLNQIDGGDKKNRLNSEKFNEELDQLLARIDVSI